MKISTKLGRKEIEKAVAQLSPELEKAGVARDKSLLLRLSLEEILILYLEASQEGVPFKVKTRKRKGNLDIILTVDGKAADPFGMESPFLGHFIERMEEKPVWEYRDNTNTITFRFNLYNSTYRNYAFAWKYLRKYKKTLFLSLFIQLISVAFGVIAPILSARIIMRLMNDQVILTVIVAAILFIVKILKNLLLVLSNRGYNRIYCSMLSALEGDLVMEALKIRNQCMEEKGSGLFIQRLTGDTTRMAVGFSRIADMTAQAINYIGILLAMLYLNIWIFLLALSLLAIESVLEIYRTRRLYKDDRVFRNANEKFSGFIGEMVRGARDVKQLSSEESFGREASERVFNANEKRLIMQSNSWRMKLIRWEFSELGTFSFIALMALFVGHGWIVLPTAVVLYNYFTSLDARAVTLAGEFMEYVKDFNLSVERICAVMNSPEFPKEHFGNTQLATVHGEIRFENVTFGYNERDLYRHGLKVLDGLSFTIHPGEMVAFVGKSGCGKTTILNLLGRLYDPQKGRILLDGEDIMELTKESLRGSMTVVNQVPYIFNMSVKDNLRLSKENMTDEEMKYVCNLACIDDDIEKMPDGYETVIGEGGVNLSGGQRQRLAIARSMLKDYRVILFDEATSALDNVTQAKIQKAIDAIRKDRTVILIAHRLSTVLHADRILYMSNGKILAEGTHEELLKTCEQYRLLYNQEAGEKGELIS
ncbi:MAG: ABC transporter ATP-binding protein/permease [Lachnospiraceae bacterium]|nr:ABC transporter ATP-binding protein/permease [Lachnospiraceae bacterium]